MYGWSFWWTRPGALRQLFGPIVDNLVALPFVSNKAEMVRETTMEGGDRGAAHLIYPAIRVKAANWASDSSVRRNPVNAQQPTEEEDIASSAYEE